MHSYDKNNNNHFMVIMQANLCWPATPFNNWRTSVMKKSVPHYSSHSNDSAVFNMINKFPSPNSCLKKTPESHHT